MDTHRETIMRLSELADLIGLREHIISGTRYGKKPGPSKWHYLRHYMKGYADPQNTDAVIALFESVGAADEIQAVRFLLKHDEMVP